jgi:predicted nucleic acid-binding protein
MRALIDTSALLALSRSRDQHHARSVDLADRHLAGGGRFLGSTLVLGEFHAHLLQLRGPTEARTALEQLLRDPAHEWMEVTPALVGDALAGWLARFQDQGFTLVDAVSFELMRVHGIRHAFAFDRHFQVAGFELLGMA